ncbi:TNF receptor-associated factor 5-like [Branchiostoma floridae x Branchiostoma belcheri]
MAEDGPLAGIHPSVFVCTREYLEDLECGICQYVANNPRLCKQGHQFCKNCIAEWIKCTESCPHCRTPIDDVRTLPVALSIKNIIDKTKAKCTNGDASSKCSWTGPYGSIAVHDRSCLHKKVHCERCGKVMFRRDLEHHMGICPEVPVQCETCGNTMERSRVSKHRKFLCGDEHVSCPLQCGETVQRKGIVQHVLTCQKYRKTCPVPGCQEILRDQATHNDEKGRQHTLLLLKAMIQPNKEVQVNGVAHGFTWTVSDATIMTKSAPIKTANHEWALLVLPTDRHNRKHLGLYVQMLRGDPTIVALRMKVTYKNIARQFGGEMFAEPGGIKGWENVILDEELDQEDQASRLTVDVIVQFF